jgi:hypothetical protein
MTSLLCDSCGRTSHDGPCPTDGYSNNDWRLDLHLKSGQTISVWFNDRERAEGLVEQIAKGEQVRVLGKGRPMLADRQIWVPAGNVSACTVEHDPASEYARQLGAAHGL